MQYRSVGTLALYGASLGVHQNLTEAVVPVQLRLEGALDAEFADQRRARIGCPIDALESCSLMALT